MDVNEQLRVKCECQGEQKACKCELGKAGSFIYDVMIQHEANMANLKFSRILLGYSWPPLLCFYHLILEFE
uniref:Uncharacterized protein n=1 Tax=Kalanchoe fedtschenkoi TaxID=63787 RepID=A0A7N1A847_KALFE